MKRIITTVLLIVVALVGRAQDTTGPTTTWPYLYPAFRPGTLVMAEGKTQSFQLNIQIRHDKLHYLDKDGNIQEANLSNVVGAEIDGDQYLNLEGAMLQVVAMDSNGCVVAEHIGDFAALMETGGAYGSASNTSATRKLSSIDTDNQINQNHMLLYQQKEDGQDVPMLTQYYLVYQGQRIPCGNATLFQGSLTPEQKTAWKEWKKTHKIKWNKPDSLVQLLHFLAQ